MGNVGGGEILVILLVALIFLGPEKLPEVSRQIGKVVGEIRRMTTGFQREMQDAMRLIDDAAKEPETPRPVDAITVEAAALEAPVDATPSVAGDDAPMTDDVVPVVATTDETVPVTSEAPPLPVASEAPPLPVEHDGAALEATAPVLAEELPYDAAHGGDR